MDEILDPQESESVPAIATGDVAEQLADLGLLPEETASPPPAPLWADELAKLDPKEFRRVLNQHDKLAGVIGYELQQKLASELPKHQQQWASEHAGEIERARRETVEALGDEARQTLEGASSYVAQQVGASVGAYLRNGAGLTEHETAAFFNQVASALVGKADHEAPAAFLAASTAVLAKRENERWRREELAKEREAIRAEVAYYQMRATPVPGGGDRAKGPAAAINIREMTDGEFDDYYKRRFKR